MIACGRTTPTEEVTPSEETIEEEVEVEKPEEVEEISEEVPEEEEAEEPVEEVVEEEEIVYKITIFSNHEGTFSVYSVIVDSSFRLTPFSRKN